MILNILPQTLPHKATEICHLTTQAFVHNDLDIQKRVLSGYAYFTYGGCQ